jgi:hypothetical protein
VINALVLSIGPCMLIDAAGGNGTIAIPFVAVLVYQVVRKPEAP